MIANLAGSALFALLVIVGYILSSLSLGTLAKRRGILHPWLAWIPVARCWLLGCISDQYRHIARGQIKGRRRLLPALSVIGAVLLLAVSLLLVGALSDWMEARQAATDFYRGGIGPKPDYNSWPLICMLLAAAALAFPAIGVAISGTIIRYMALWDLYLSCGPGRSAVFLVLSILLGITEPFFLFYCRKKDAGMISNSCS